jgi:hypothetical protein
MAEMYFASPGEGAGETGVRAERVDSPAKVARAGALARLMH